MSSETIIRGPVEARASAADGSSNLTPAASNDVSAPPKTNAAQSLSAEIANSITHGLGFALSVVATIVLWNAARPIGGWRFTACMIYAVTMLGVYGASTASHVVWHRRAKHIWRMIDQGCIYLFIAGSFTPVAAAYLHGGLWWLLLGAIWTIAVGSFIAKVSFSHRIDSASVAIPIVLGWMPLLGGPALLAAVPAVVVWWMLAGGICYTLGTLFLINDHRHPLVHALWHLWVIAGTACQFWAIFHFTLAPA